MTSNLTSNVSLQLISDRSSLADAIEETGDVTLEQVHFLNAPGGWKSRSTSFDVTVLDMSAHGNTTDDAISHIRALKAVNPSHVIIVIGNKTQLADLLESDAQPLLYRVFSNHTSTRQILSAVRSAGQLLQRSGRPPIPVNVKTNIGGSDEPANDQLVDEPTDKLKDRPVFVESQPEPTVQKQPANTIRSLFARVKNNKFGEDSDNDSASQSQSTSTTDNSEQSVEPAEDTAKGKIKSIVANFIGNRDQSVEEPAVEDDSPETAALESVNEIEPEQVLEPAEEPEPEHVLKPAAEPEPELKTEPEPPAIVATRDAPNDIEETPQAVSTSNLLFDADETPNADTANDDFFAPTKPDIDVGILRDSKDDEVKPNESLLSDSEDASSESPKVEKKEPSVIYIYEDPIDDESTIRKAPFLIFATVGMPLLALTAYLLLGNQGGLGTNENEPILTNQQPTASEQVSAKQTDAQSATSQKSTDEPKAEATDNNVATALVDSLKTVGKTVADAVSNQLPEPPPIPRISGATMAQLLKWAQAAEAEARLFEPKEDNAVFYYEAMLKRNSANPTARNGRFRALKNIEKELRVLVAEKEFVRANEVLTRFDYSLPRHRNSARLFNIISSGLNREIAAVQNNPNGDIDSTIDVLNQLGARFAKPRDAMLRYKKEYVLLAEIDQAIANGILMPPDQRNAFDHIMYARRNGLVDGTKLNDRALEISALLYAQAEPLLESEEIDTAAPIVAAVELLNVDQSSIKKLQLLLDRANTIAENGGEEEPKPAKKPSLELNPPEPVTSAFGQATVNQPTVETSGESLITEAKVLHIVEPEYPSEAQSQKIEGWVELNFVVDEEGNLRDLSVVNQQPANVFTDAAIDAIAQWRFEPAVDQIARANVPSNFSVRLDFTLPQ